MSNEHNHESPKSERHTFAGMLAALVLAAGAVFFYLNVVYLDQQGASDLRGTDPIEFRKMQESVQTGPSGSVTKLPPAIDEAGD